MKLNKDVLDMLPKKSMIALILTAGSVVSVALILNPVVPQSTEKTQPLPRVRVQKIQHDHYNPQYFSYGTFVLASSDVVNAPLSDKIFEVKVKNGQTVNKDEELIIFDQKKINHQIEKLALEKKVLEDNIANIEHTLQTLHQQLDLLAKQTDLTEKHYDRTQSLYQKGHASEQSMEHAHQQWLKHQQAQSTTEQSYFSSQTQLKNLQHQKQLLQVQQKELLRQKDLHVIKAPFSGKINQVFITEGQTVSYGQNLLRLTSNDHLKFKVFVPKTVMLTDKDLSVEIKRDSTNLMLNKFEWIDDHRPGHLVKTAVFDLPNGLDFIKGEVEPVLLHSSSKVKGFRVPDQSVYDGQFVYVVRDGQLKIIAIKSVARIEDWGGRDQVVKSDQLHSGDDVLVTRMPSVIDGLKVLVIQ